MIIKAIIFDCFGVLVEDSINSFYKTYLPNEPEKVEQIKHYDHLSTSGQLTYDEFLNKMSEIAEMDRVEISRLLDINPANQKLFDYITKNLKGNYKIGFLSNAADNWLDMLFSKEQQAIFDDFVLSYEYSMNKPSSGIFKLAAERLGVDTKECVMIDDVADYCDGARKSGMQAIRYETYEQMKYELEKIISYNNLQ